MLLVLYGLSSDMEDVKYQAQKFEVPSELDFSERKPVKAVEGSELVEKSLIEDSKNVVWKKSLDGAFTVPRYIVCKGDDCTSVIPFNTKVCPTCETHQGYSRAEDSLRKDLLADTDQDGIINGIEDRFEFLDRNDKYDAYLDYDGDGFCNIQEINADLSAEEVQEHFLAKKMFAFDPQDINESPELATLLRMETSNQAKKMGITLKSVSEEEEDKKMWLVAFNAEKNGKVKTLFKRIGGEVTTNTGMVLSIEDVEKVETKEYKSSVKEYVTKVDYTVFLKNAEGQIYQVKRNEFVIHGSKTVQFVYFNHHSSRRLPRFEVEERGKFDLSVEKDGKVIRGEKFTLTKIGTSSSQVVRDKDGKSFTIGMVSGADRELHQKRYEAARNASQNK